MKVDKIFRVGYKYHPKSKGALIKAIEAEIEFQGPEADLNCIDTSEITDMSYLFSANSHGYANNFNGDISEWNVSNVKNMSCMFYDTKNFNRDISNWDVSNVKDMSSMFMFAKSFNQDISNWDVSNVEDTSHMFHDAINFNQDISNWDVSNIKDIFRMFLVFDNCPIKEEYKPKFSI